MRNLVQRLQYFFFGDVNKILSGFNKLSKKLDKAAEFHTARAHEADEAIRRANAAREAAISASLRAATVKANIANLLGE